MVQDHMILMSKTIWSWTISRGQNLKKANGKPVSMSERSRAHLRGALAKAGIINWAEYRSEKHAKTKQTKNKQTNPNGKMFFPFFFNLLIFVNFYMFTVHILRNCCEKIKYIF